MTTDKSSSSGGAQAGNSASSGGLIDTAFKAGISAAEDIHKRAFEIPLSILEGMGAPDDKVQMLRDKSQSMIGELYTAINSVASQLPPIESASSDDRGSAAADKSATEKSE
jgi:hypothetical protein